MDNKTILKITVGDLEHLLRQQKEITAEHIYGKYKAGHANIPPQIDNAFFLNNAQTSPYPAEFRVLKKYLS